MALLGAIRRGWPKLRAKTLVQCWLVLLALLFPTSPNTSAQTTAAREFQIKAVFLYNFAQFVDWPPGAFAGPQSPLIIGILGQDPFGAYMNEVVRGEKVNNRLISLRHFNRVEEIKTCHILYISPSEAGNLDRILASLKGRSILTVSDADEFTHFGGIIRFVTENNKIRLRINNNAAKSAGLKISSKLLRPSQIVSRRRN